MTALALALVACCAMVCGTYLAKRRYDIQETDAERSIRADMNLARRISDLEKAGLELRAEVESLRASSAFRSM